MFTVLTHPPEGRREKGGKLATFWVNKIGVFSHADSCIYVTNRENVRNIGLYAQNSSGAYRCFCVRCIKN